MRAVRCGPGLRGCSKVPLCRVWVLLLICCCLAGLGTQLTGTIPKEYPEAPHLWWYDFGYNRLSGSVPDTFMCAATAPPHV